MKVWRNHFRELLAGADRRIEGERREQGTAEEDEIELSDAEIEKQIRRLKKKKATGGDKIPNEAWIYSEGSIREKLKRVIRKVWAGKGFPNSWRKAVITALHKKGDAKNPANYRGISLLSTAYKIYASVLNERLRDDIEAKRILPETQAGFRQHRGTLDNAYILQHVIERETQKQKGKVYAMFVDVKAAFDTVRREKLWKDMEECKIRKGLIERVKEVYEETRNAVRVNEEESEEFWTGVGLRQGCPLSPTLFTVYIAEMEEELGKRQVGGGVTVGGERFYSLAYADDVVLLATREEELRRIMKRLQKYMDKKGLTLNTAKSKIMVFGKGRMRTKNQVWKWQEKELEIVKEFNYLGILFQRNGNMVRHMEERVRRASVVVNQVWGIGERKFKSDFKMRMFLWDSLIAGVLLYGVELWGFKERGEVEQLQIKYIKWILGLDMRTPNYIVLEETKRAKIRVRAGQRALRFEEGIREGIGRRLLKECLKEKEEGRQKTRSMEEKEGYLIRNGLSRLGWGQERREGREIKETMERLRRRDIERQGQAQYEKIQRSRYNEKYKAIVEVGLPEYLCKTGNGESQQLIAQARCGSMERWNKYWEEEEKRKCDLCGEAPGTLEHLTRECRKIDNKIRIEKVLSGGKNEEREKWLKMVKEKRKIASNNRQ